MSASEMERLRAALRPFAEFDVPTDYRRKGYRGTVYATSMTPGKTTELTVDDFDRARAALSGSSAPQAPDSEIRVALAELLRLYDWRFVLAEREKDPTNCERWFRDETLRLLRQYGTEKKAAWNAARAALSMKSEGPATPGTNMEQPEVWGCVPFPDSGKGGP